MRTNPRRYAVTIVARNYLPQARVLAESFTRHHPDATFATVIIDGDDTDRSALGVGNVLLPADLGVPTAEWHAMAAIYTVMEFATAVKPAALRHLLATNDATGVLYLDPDIEVMAPLTDLYETLAAPNPPIVLTPHVLTPMPRDGLQPEESGIRHSGIFNLGFCGVARGAEPFLDWWHERLITDCVVDLGDALFTDQRWIDWVPALFSCTVLRDPGLNVAYWNLHERPLSRDAHGALHADGAAVKFFHFSGYDPTMPWRLSKHAGDRPRVLIDSDPILRDVTAAYGQRLIEAGFGQPGAGYRYDRSADGIELLPIIRTALRRRLTRTDTGASLAERVNALPDAIDPAKVSEFRAWLSAPCIGPDEANITAWEYELHQGRGDLRDAFQHLDGPGAFAYRQWLDTSEDAAFARELKALVDAHWRPSTATIRSLADRESIGWNLVGYLRSEHGVGEQARRFEMALDMVGLPIHRVAVSAPGSRHDHPDAADADQRLRYRDSVYVINADRINAVASALEHRSAARGDARRIGVWAWEVDIFPASFADSFRLLDEVWVTSHHMREAIAAISPIPVRVVPMVVTEQTPSPFDRHLLGLPNGFCFLHAFDFNSIMERKNPTGVISAYCAAFSPADGAHLILKSIGGEQHPDHRALIEALIAERPDIHLLDGHMSTFEMQGLIEQTDCFVSLHRSEGFGLNLAAAMAAGRPVIATGYSGNLDFMTADTAALVPYRLVDVGPGKAPYPPNARWAEPDLDAAAAAMRSLFDDPAEAARLGAAGRSHVLDVMSRDRAVAAIRHTLLREPPEGTTLA